MSLLAGPAKLNTPHGAILPTQMPAELGRARIPGRMISFTMLDVKARSASVTSTSAKDGKRFVIGPGRSANFMAMRVGLSQPLISPGPYSNLMRELLASALNSADNRPGLF